MKTRTETRTRQVPHTVNGVTRMVTETYQVPAPPRDWDHIVLTGAYAVTALTVAASVAWTTASIGDLLSRAAVAPVAYGAASAFDAAWITCMAVEWLSRYDRQRARLPRAAGYIALAISMTSVGTNGWLTNSPAVGLIGAAVSALAKGLWTVVLAHTARPLDPRTAQWVEQAQAEAGAQLGMVAVERQVTRAQAAVLAERAALALDGPVTAPVTAPSPLVAAPEADLSPAPVTAPVTAPVQPVSMAQPAPAAPSSRPRYADPAVDAIRALYETGYRPGTRMMQDAVLAATGTRPSDSACRAKLRPQIEAPTAEPHLAELPPAPITLPPRTA